MPYHATAKEKDTTIHDPKITLTCYLSNEVPTCAFWIILESDKTRTRRHRILIVTD